LFRLIEYGIILIADAFLGGEAISFL